MAYEVLARKYRSRTFDEIVGQSAIATTLKNAVGSDRVHHGYLFTGTRGVGKTSTARILAKALNCTVSDGPTPDPCCKCESCLRIAEGEDLDVLEIDAASNTGVDNIRELRSNAAFKPARSRFKVYIIDEVHMLSTGAFNALLKTLEEPPEHVKFVLATTEAHKVPATIKSRCQRFDFRAIGPADIAEQLQRILTAENIEADESVVRRLARLANGSMRDALSLLDQLLAFGTQKLTSEMMEDLLPPEHDEVVFEMIEAIADQKPSDALHCVDRSLVGGYTAGRFCEVVIEHLRNLMILNVCQGSTDLMDLPASIADQMKQQAERFDAATYVYMISLMEQVLRQTKQSNAPRPLVDAAVVRLALAEQFSDVRQLIARIESGAPTDSTPKKKAGADLNHPPPRPAGRQPTVNEPPHVEPSSTPPSRPQRAPVATTTAAPGEADSHLSPSDGKSPTSAPGAGRRAARTVDRRLVMGSPLVRKALELTGGKIVDIQPAAADADIDKTTIAGAKEDVSDS